MSQTSGDILCSEMEFGKRRESKLTEKALVNKVEKLQKERKHLVNKIKRMIPDMKELMKHKGNMSTIKNCLEKLNKLCECANNAHDELLPLLPQDEFDKQVEWLSSVMNYTETFKNETRRWIKETEQYHTNLQEQPELNEINEHLSNFCDVNEDEIKPGHSISNVGSRKCSMCSSASSARLIAEAELAALATRQSLLNEKHALEEEELRKRKARLQLEEEEEQLRKRKEKLQLDTEIAEKLAKLSILEIQSSTSGNRSSKVSDGMNSYLKKGKIQQQLNVNAKDFHPSAAANQETINNDGKQSVKQTVMENITPSYNKVPQYSAFEREPANMQCVHQLTSNPSNNAPDVENDNVLAIMRKQNEITTLLIQQQCLAALPKRDIPIFDGDPLKYHIFMKAFENGVERNTTDNSDRLYFLEQYTNGHAKELVRSCQYQDPDHGYLRAKALIKEQFGNEQKIAFCYMDKALSWPTIGTEDVKALQDYSLFLRGCCNAMEDVQYLHDLDMPSNMLSIVKRLPYKLRDRWRSQVCELQEQRQRRAKFSDIADFIERQVKILTDPVFGNIHDSPPIMNKGTYKLRAESQFKGASFATTIGPVENEPEPAKKDGGTTPALNTCIFCGAGHTLVMCAQLGRMEHEKKIEFLKGNGFCFSCLCTGHISKHCRKKISCSKCNLKHPTVLHREKDSERAEKDGGVRVDMLVSNGLTGAGDQDCKLPIVPVRVKSKKGSKIVTTYAFLDQGSTAVFVTESLMNKLQLTGMKGHILLSTMGQRKVVSGNMVSGLEVAALHGDEFLHLPKVYTQESMPVYKGNIPTEKDIEKWPHLKHIHLPQINAGIELLIGINVPRALEPLEVVCSVDGGPFATRTMLGWTVNGPLGGSSEETVDREPHITSNRVSVVNLVELWQQQFKNDFPESSLGEQAAMSREDQRFLDSVKHSVKHLNDHYQISPALKQSTLCMPNNRKLVEQRLQHLKRRPQKNSTFYHDYNTFINDLLAKGYAIKVPEEELKRADGKVWYIPHHGVYHPTKVKFKDKPLTRRGILTPAAGAFKMDRSKKEPQCGRSHPHHGQHSASELVAHGTSNPNLSGPQGICPSGTASKDMKLNPQQAPLYGQCVVTVQLADEELAAADEGVDYFLLFAGSTQRHLTATERSSHDTLVAQCPAHNCCEVVLVTLCSLNRQIPQGSEDHKLPLGRVSSLAEHRFSFVQDLAFDMAQFLVSTAGRADGLDGALLLDECQIPLQECERLDESLALALHHLTLPPGWSLLGTKPTNSTDLKPQETLLHFSARRGLFRVTRFLLHQPGAREALRLANRQDETPISLAAARGHECLYELLIKAEADTESLTDNKTSQPVSLNARVFCHQPRLNTHTLTETIHPGCNMPTLQESVEQLLHSTCYHAKRVSVVDVHLDSWHTAVECCHGVDAQSTCLEQLNQPACLDSLTEGGAAESLSVNSCGIANSGHGVTGIAENQRSLSSSNQTSELRLREHGLGPPEDWVCLSSNADREKCQTKEEEGREHPVSTQSSSDRSEAVQREFREESLTVGILPPANGVEQGEEADRGEAVIREGEEARKGDNGLEQEAEDSTGRRREREEEESNSESTQPQTTSGDTKEPVMGQRASSEYASDSSDSDVEEEEDNVEEKDSSLDLYDRLSLKEGDVGNEELTESVSAPRDLPNPLLIEPDDVIKETDSAAPCLLIEGLLEGEPPPDINNPEQNQETAGRDYAALHQWDCASLTGSHSGNCTGTESSKDAAELCGSSIESNCLSVDNPGFRTSGSCSDDTLDCEKMLTNELSDQEPNSTQSISSDDDGSFRSVGSSTSEIFQPSQDDGTVEDGYMLQTMRVELNDQTLYESKEQWENEDESGTDNGLAVTKWHHDGTEPDSPLTIEPLTPAGTEKLAVELSNEDPPLESTLLKSEETGIDVIETGESKNTGIGVEIKQPIADENKVDILAEEDIEVDKVDDDSTVVAVVESEIMLPELRQPQLDTSMMEADETSMMEVHDTSMMEADETSMMEADETSTMEADDTSTMEANDTATMAANDTSMMEANDGSLSESVDVSSSDANLASASTEPSTEAQPENQSETLETRDSVDGALESGSSDTLQEVNIISSEEAVEDAAEEESSPLEETRFSTMHRDRDASFHQPCNTEPSETSALPTLSSRSSSSSTTCPSSAHRDSGSDTESFLSVEPGYDSVFTKNDEPVTGGDSTSEVSISLSSTDDTASVGLSSSSPDGIQGLSCSWSPEEGTGPDSTTTTTTNAAAAGLDGGSVGAGETATAGDVDEEAKDKVTEVPRRSCLLRSSTRSVSPLRRHSWGPGKNHGGDAEMNQRSSLRSPGEGKPAFHRSYSLEGLSGAQEELRSPPIQGPQTLKPLRVSRQDSEERGSLVSLTEEQEDGEERSRLQGSLKLRRYRPLRNSCPPMSLPLTKSVSMLAISQRDIDAVGCLRRKRRISFSFSLSPILTKSKSHFNIGDSSSTDDDEDNLSMKSYTSTSGSLAYSISEEEPGPLRSDTEGKGVTKVSRTFSYLKNKMYKKTREKEKEKKEKEKETKEKDKKTINGHLYTILASNQAPQCSQCNKAFNNKETFYCSYCTASVHKGCRDSLPACAKVKMKLPKQQSTVPDSGSFPTVTMRSKSGGTRERPWSAILSPEDHSSLMIPSSRRPTSIMSFHGNNLSKSLSINNIAGPVFDEIPIKGLRYLSQSTDSLNRTNQVTESMESLTDEGTEMMDGQLMGEFEADAKEFESDSWSICVEQQYLQHLDKELVKRQDIIYELMQTEMHHIRTLRIMSEVYSKGLQKEVQLEQQTLEKLLPVLDDLLELHTQLLLRLLERKKDSQLESGSLEGGFVISRIGDILVSQFSGSTGESMKRVYGRFCSRHNEAVNIYKDLLTKDKRFKAFTKKKMSSSIVRRLGIPECILLVTQRITKYPVLIQRMLQHTKVSDEDYDDLVEAIRLVKEVIASVDSKVNEHDKKRRLREFHSRTDSKSIMMMKSGQIFAREDLLRRRLIHDGALQLKNMQGRLKEVHALLLSDVFVFLQEKDQKYIYAMLDQRSTVISLQKLIVREVANEERGLFFITAGIEKPEMMEVLASSKDERNTWMQLIQEAMQSMEKDEDEGIPSETEDDKRQLENKTKEMRDMLRQKDTEIMSLLEEKVRLFRGMCEGLNPSEETCWQTEPFFRSASSLEVPRGASIMKDALQEVETLQTLVNGSLGGAMASIQEGRVGGGGGGVCGGAGPVCLPRRAETFGGFDSHQMHSNKSGDREESEDMVVDLRRTESDSVLKKGGNAGLMLLKRNSEQLLQSISNLHLLLSSLQAVVVQQDSFIEDQRQALSERSSSLTSLTRTSSRPSSLVEQEKQRSLEKQRQEMASLQRQQAAHAEERRRREREWDVREQQLSEREGQVHRQEEEIEKQNKHLEEEKQDLQSRTEKCQKDLERLRDAQRKLDRDKEAVQRQLHKMEELRGAERTSSTTSDESQFAGSSRSLGELDPMDLPPASSLSLPRLPTQISKSKGKGLNPFTSSSPNMKGSESNNQISRGLLQLTKNKSKDGKEKEKEKKKKKNKGGSTQAAEAQSLAEPSLDEQIFFC